MYLSSPFTHSEPEEAPEDQDGAMVEARQVEPTREAPNTWPSQFLRITN